MWWFWALLCHTWPHSVPLRAGGTSSSSSSSSSPFTRRRWCSCHGTSSDPGRHSAGRRHTTRTLHHGSYNLYENEARSDVILLVGDDLYHERIPAHSWILQAGNPVLKAMLQWHGNEPDKKQLNIRNDPKGFQNLMKWLYRHECVLQSVEGGLITLQVAIQYLCPELADLCVQYISSNLTPANVLRVFQEIYRYCPAQDQQEHTLPAVPSAPSLEELQRPSQEPTPDQKTKDKRSRESLSQLHDLCEEADLRDPTACCGDLFNTCLEMIDRNTSAVLASEYLEDLDAAALEVIVRRGSLNLTSEVEVVGALQRWSTARCRRHNLPLTQQSRRTILGHLLGHVRFLVMRGEQLQEATSFLTTDEYNYLSGRISGRGAGEAPHSLAPYLAVMATPRCPATTLSSSSKTINNKNKKKSTGKKKYTKKELILDILSCLAVIFD
ncbi:hypothetical protein Pcinc_037555 [Petrolisthes cinctipes]|uniref:BTB domain-containing protein n=1 Tax=Petrolisthes cinctipes TaxID=88211 RepID=A0AAE1BSA3_PETCI|nr:hypothetical protein Pcinc_037555 [Petrolisthes cinctipes]